MTNTTKYEVLFRLWGLGVGIIKCVYKNKNLYEKGLEKYEKWVFRVGKKD